MLNGFQSRTNVSYIYPMREVYEAFVCSPWYFENLHGFLDSQISLRTLEIVMMSNPSKRQDGQVTIGMRWLSYKSSCINISLILLYWSLNLFLLAGLMFRRLLSNSVSESRESKTCTYPEAHPRPSYVSPDSMAQLGVKQIYGVPGDFNLGFLDLIEDHDDLEWVGCCNELNSSYAADGYARVSKGKHCLLRLFLFFINR